MKRTEQTAREMCALDLRAHGIAERRVADLVERFWPILANEIRQGVVDGEWPFAAGTIEALGEEYRKLLGES
ncbi:hypothetical protein [Ancylobacter sp. SL191]|uniref:hypothetical protein n=1 Tax=Ancylobacter sp. SL191 TaxID=2995166 RepID=UPI00226D75CA|nr:hypothetical protein [Ancylobacter sp. SL191]WAC27167.1 hypothetical protein OU996_19565 [Ancylobacter sp. SL191]